MRVFSVISVRFFIWTPQFVPLFCATRNNQPICYTFNSSVYCYFVELNWQSHIYSFTHSHTVNGLLYVVMWMTIDNNWTQSIIFLFSLSNKRQKQNWSRKLNVRKMNKVNRRRQWQNKEKMIEKKTKKTPQTSKCNHLLCTCAVADFSFFQFFGFIFKSFHIRFRNKNWDLFVSFLLWNEINCITGKLVEWMNEW